MQYDELILELGEWGMYQWLLASILYCIALLGSESFAVNLIAATMDHWCQVTGLENMNYEQQKYISIPQDEDGSYSKCEQFDVSFDNYTVENLMNWNRTLMIENFTATTRCRHWVYDRSEFASTLVTKFDLVCSRQDLVPLVSTLYMVGVTIGTFASGPISDKVGRKITILIGILIKILAALMGIFANNFVLFCISRVISGIGIFGSIMPAMVLVMEQSSPAQGTYLVMGVQMCVGIGTMVVSAMSYAIRDYQWLTLAYMIPCVVFVVFWWVMPESPRWLLLKGRHREAEKTLRLIAAVNKRPLPPTFDVNVIKKEAAPKKQGTLRNVFQSPILRTRTWILAFYTFSLGMIYYALSFNVGALSGNLFVNNTILGAVEIPAGILCAVFSNWRRMGRRLTLSIAMTIAGVTCFLRLAFILKGFGTADTAMSYIGRVFVSLSFAGIYMFSAEVFPTDVRSAGVSFVGTFAQISGIAASYIGGPLSRVWTPLPNLLLAVLALASGLSLLVIPQSTGQRIYETVEEFNLSIKKDATGQRIYETVEVFDLPLQNDTSVKSKDNPPSTIPSTTTNQLNEVNYGCQEFTHL